MIQVVVTYIGENKHYSYVCTPEGAWELFFTLHGSARVRIQEVKSMNGYRCKLTEHGWPEHGIHSLYDLASHVNVK
jgi:hypothetical protein